MPARRSAGKTHRKPYTPSRRTPARAGAQAAQPGAGTGRLAWLLSMVGAWRGHGIQSGGWRASAQGAAQSAQGLIGGTSSGSAGPARPAQTRSEEHTSELQSLMRISYAVFCLKKKNTNNTEQQIQQNNSQITLILKK